MADFRSLELRDFINRYIRPPSDPTNLDPVEQLIEDLRASIYGQPIHLTTLDMQPTFYPHSLFQGIVPNEDFSPTFPDMAVATSGQGFVDFPSPDFGPFFPEPTVATPAEPDFIGTVALHEPGVSTTTHNISLPSGFVAGEVVIVVVACRGGQQSFNWPSPWTEVHHDANDVVMGIGWANAADIAGDTVVSITTDVERRLAGVAFRVNAVDTTDPIKVVSSAGGNSNTPNPPSVDGGASASYLALCGFCIDSDSLTGAVSAPTGYNIVGQAEVQTSFVAGNVVAKQQISAQTEDPGNFANNIDIENWVAWTMLVNPSPGPVTNDIDFDAFDASATFPEGSLAEVVEGAILLSELDLSAAIPLMVVADAQPAPDIESFPQVGDVDRNLSPTSSQSEINAIQAGEIVELAPGDYGDKNFNSIPGNVYLFCRAYLEDTSLFNPPSWNGTPASFEHVHDGVCYDDPFAWNVDGGTTMRGLKVRGYSPNPKSGTDHRGSGPIKPGGSGVTFMDFELSRSRESAIYPTSPNTTIKRFYAHLLGKYMWGGGVGDNCEIDTFWCHDVYTSAARNAGMEPEQVSSDRGVCKNPGGVDGLDVRNGKYWDIDGKGVWWDGAGTNGTCREIWAKNVEHNVVSAEVSLGPFVFEDIYAEDSANNNKSSAEQDVIAAVVLWPLTPFVTVRRVEAVRCGNGVTTHNRRHPVLDNGAGPYSAQYMRNNLGVRDCLIEDCDLSGIDGGSGSLDVRWSAGWNGGGFTYDGDTIQFEPPVWQNNAYYSGAQFRAGGDWPLSLSQWQSQYGMS